MIIQNTFIATVVFIILTIIVYLTSNYQNNKFGGIDGKIYDWVLIKLDDTRDNLPILTLNEITETRKYEKSANIFRIKAHIGQRKLFLTELQHLINVDNKQPFVVVYVGAAPSVHSGFLLELFPQMKWLGIDPNEFSLNMLRKSHGSESKIHNIDEYSDNHYAYPEKSVYLYPSDRDMYPTSCEKNMQIYNFETKTVNTEIRNQIAKLEEKQRFANENMGEIAKIINDREERIYFWENVMSNELAENLEKLHNYFPLVLFWSDIRTTMFSEKIIQYDSGKKSSKIADDKCTGTTNLDILWNSAQQFNWVNIIKPQYFMLKIRPYYLLDNVDPLDILGSKKNNLISDSIYKNEIEKDLLESKKYGIDFLEEYSKGNYLYFDGDIYLQPFCGSSSIEIRLHGKQTNNKYEIKNYDTKNIEEKLFYFNQFARTYIHRENSNSDPDIGFDHCNDCAIENNIWKAFIAKYQKEKPVLYFVKRLIVATNNRGFFTDKHGYFYLPYTKKSLLKFSNNL